jgi:ATP-dependent Clp protease ATP-binding subunit ClpB
MLEGEAAKLLHMEEHLRRRVIGQEEAIRIVSNTLRRSRAGIADPDRPIGSFFFMGPTGVGKTELVRSLAEFLFDDERAMVRLDMSEYMEKHSVSRLVGAPPGYVGYDEGGQLTEAVRRRPYTVVLLDEFEKAHPDVHNVLLQVMDEGRLTDGKGRTVNFRNAVIVMTSNLASEAIREAEVRGEDPAGLVDHALRGHFRPEFLNRLDDVVVFGPLDAESIRKIAGLQIDRLRRTLAGRGIGLRVSEAAADLLAREGYDPQFGARLLRGVFAEGVTVLADVDGDSRLTLSSEVPGVVAGSRP